MNPRKKRMSLATALVASMAAVATAITSAVPTEAAATYSSTSGTTYKVPDAGYGFQDGATLTSLSASDLNRELDMVASTTATWIRVPIHWNKIESTKGTYDWAATDRVIEAAKARGLNVLGTVAYAPSWAAATGATTTAPPKNVETWGSFVSVMAKRYVSKVAAFEIWNEPNLDTFFGGNANAYLYAPLLQSAYKAIKAVSPKTPVVSGGLSPDGVDPKAYLTKVYEAGAKGAMDAVGFHPYVTVGSGEAGFTKMKQTLSDLNSLMASKGDGAKKIWATEFGTSSPSSGQSYESQAQMALRQLGVLADIPYLGPALLYTIRDTGKDRTKIAANFGQLATYGWQPKPLLTYLADPQ